MIIAETIYTVGNFKFDNFKDAERFNIYLDLGYFNDEQLTKLYMGYKNKIDYTIYANPKFNVYQMGRIYTGLTKGLDVSVYAKPAFDDEQMAEIMLGLSEGLDVSTYAKPEYKWNIMRVMRLELRGK
jgi:hypothetical protein